MSTGNRADVSDKYIEHKIYLFSILKRKTVLINRKKKRKRPVTLRTDQIDYLISQNTLEAWAGFSLEERVVLFHRKFIDVKITPQRLSAIYKRFGVSKKKVRLIKKPVPYEN